MSKPNVEPYLKVNVRLRSSVGGPSTATPFEKFCHHWQIANQRILDDLRIVSQKSGVDYLTLSFDDLVAGRLESFESFTGIKLTRRVRPPVNQRATRVEGKFPEYQHWSSDQKETLQQICGPLWDKLSQPAKRIAA